MCFLLYPPPPLQFTYSAWVGALAHEGATRVEGILNQMRKASGNSSARPDRLQGRILSEFVVPLFVVRAVICVVCCRVGSRLVVGAGRWVLNDGPEIGRTARRFASRDSG